MTAVAPNRPAQFTKRERWQPKKWEAMHEQMVIMSALGRSNVEIAKTFGYSAQQVCNILASDEATIVRARTLDTLRKTAVKQLDGALEDLATQSIIRMKEVMYDDDLFTKSPFAVVDRGLAILRGVGKLRADGASSAAPRTIVMSTEDAAAIAAGLKVADEAKRLNAPSIEVPVKVSSGSK